MGSFLSVPETIDSFFGIIDTNAGTIDIFMFFVCFPSFYFQLGFLNPVSQSTEFTFSDLEFFYGFRLFFIRFPS